jgi:hypothetical protein
MSDWIAAGNGTWTNPANWSGGVPDAIGAVAFVDILQNGGTVLIGILENDEIVVGTMNITATGTSGLTIRGSTVDSGTGVGTLVFNNNSGNSSLFVNTTLGGGPMVFSSAFGLNMRLDNLLNVITYTSGAITRFDLDVSGAGGINKDGDGILELNGTNSFVQGVRIYDGLLHAAGDAALGPGAVQIFNNATFRSVGTIDNAFNTPSGVDGNAGSAQIVAATGTTLTLTGALNHVSNGTLSLGSVAEAGTIVASFSAITHHAAGSDFVLGGGTLRLGSATAATTLFNHIGTNTFGTDFLNPPTLDTGGFATIFGDFHSVNATIRASSGNLHLTFNGTVGGSAPQFLTPRLTLEGTNGVDQLIFNAPSVAFGPPNLLQFTNWTDGVDQIQFNGSGVDDTIRGSSQRDTINGFDGNDEIGYFNLVGGIDTISGGNGNDRIVINAANTGSFISGDAGTDTLELWGGTGVTIGLGSIAGFEALEIFGTSTTILQLTSAQFASGFAINSALSGTGTIMVNLAPGAQTMLAKGMTVAGGSNIAFTINGSSGADVIKANDATINTINGNDGADRLNGGNTGDFINGGADGDKIRGGGGADALTGGAGADIFKYRFASDAGTGIQADIINDFTVGEDKLNFRRLDPDPGTPGTQTFSFIGAAAFGATGAAQIRYVDTGNDLRVEVDVNGDGIADMHIALLGAGAGAGLLFASDFLL